MIAFFNPRTGATIDVDSDCVLRTRDDRTVVAGFAAETDVVIINGTAWLPDVASLRRHVRRNDYSRTGRAPAPAITPAPVVRQSVRQRGTAHINIQTTALRVSVEFGAAVRPADRRIATLQLQGEMADWSGAEQIGDDNAWHVNDVDAARRILRATLARCGLMPLEIVS